MSLDFLGSIRKLLNRAPRLQLVTAIALVAACHGTAIAQYPTTYPPAVAPPAVAPAAILPLPAVSATQQPSPPAQAIAAAPAAGYPSYVSPVGYLAPDTDARLEELAATVARQQAQIQAQQTQMQALMSQTQAAGNPVPQPSETQTSLNVQGPGAPPPPPYVVASDRGLVGTWTPDGPYFTSKNKDFTFHPRYLVQLDWNAMHQPSPNIGVPGGSGSYDSVSFRRLRFGVDGTMYDHIDFVSEFDFAFALQNLDPSQGATPITGLRSGGAPTVVNGVLTPQNQAGNTGGVIQPTTIFMTFKDVPVLGNIRVGNQQDWISLEHIESARFLDFMERSGLMDCFYGPNNNGYDPGISAFRTFMNQNVGLQVGAYKTMYYDSGFSYDLGNTNYTYGGRLTCTPYYDEASNGRYLVHLGIGGEYRCLNTQPFGNSGGTNIRIRDRGSNRMVPSTLDPNYADTGNFYADAQGVIDPEFAINWGPLLIQGEYTLSTFTNAQAAKGGTALGNIAFHGGYCEALYFLTGEHRIYNRTSGVFGRTIPNQNAWAIRRAGFSKGAWQVGARYEYMNLNSGLVTGGQHQDMVLGLNWWINSNARFQINYVGNWVNNSVGTTAPGTLFSLNGAKFTGQGYIQTVGARMDFSF